MILDVQNLIKTYPQGDTRVIALDQVNFSVSPGESIAIVGPSGSGKTTLLSVLAGLESVDSGSVKVAGLDMTLMNEKELGKFRASHLGIIFQQFHLMPQLTALENVSLPLELAREPDALEIARKAIQSVGLGHRSNHLPEQLSGGECQRVAIARAYVVKPKVLLADEPSGNLDSSTGEQVMKLLFDLVRERETTLVLVTHNKELAKRCGRTITISGGQIQ